MNELFSPAGLASQVLLLRLYFSTHAILTAVPMEKTISGTGAVPIATAFSFFQNF